MKAGKSGHRIYVGNIPGSMSKQEIIKAFEEFGKITEIDIKYNRNTNGTNYAFIEYESYKSAEKTIENKNGQKLKGYMLKNRSHYRVVVKNFPRKKIKLDGIKTFLMKAGKVIYTQLEDEITIAEYDCREGMLRAVNTLDRTMFNSTRKVYVRVLKDLPYDDSDADDSAQGCR